MDPKANLERQLAAARDIIERGDNPPWASEEFGGLSDKWGDEQDRSEWFEALAGTGGELAALVLALDEWRRNGGFDPYAEPLKVWLLSIETKYGTDVKLFATQEAAHATLVSFVRENWPEHGPTEPADDQEAIDEYYEYRFATDNYILDEQEVS